MRGRERVRERERERGGRGEGVFKKIGGNSNHNGNRDGRRN